MNCVFDSAAEAPQHRIIERHSAESRDDSLPVASAQELGRTEGREQDNQRTDIGQKDGPGPGIAPHAHHDLIARGELRGTVRPHGNDLLLRLARPRPVGRCTPRRPLREVIFTRDRIALDTVHHAAVFDQPGHGISLRICW